MDKITLIQRQFSRRKRFMTHLFFYVLVLSAAWIRLALNNTSYNHRYHQVSNFMPQLFFITLVWSLILFYHYFQWRMGIAEDNALLQAIEDEREWQQSGRKQHDSAEKSKRHVSYEDELETILSENQYSGHIRLTDDGELMDPIYDENEAYYDYQ